MANIIDLSVFIQDPLVLKMPHNEDTFTIPGEINTEFVIKKVYNQQEEASKIENIEEQYRGLQNLVLSILQLDESKKIDLEYIRKNLPDIRYLRIIIQEMTNHINKIQNNPN